MSSSSPPDAAAAPTAPTAEAAGPDRATGLAWSVRSSFLRYLHRGALGGVELGPGTGSMPDGRFHFPLRTAEGFDPDALTGRLAFCGGIRFLGHGGMIDVRLGGFDLALDAGRGVLRTRRRDGMLPLVDVCVEQVARTSAHVAMLLSSTLSCGAEEIFGGVYRVGDDFDDLEIRIPGGSAP